MRDELKDLLEIVKYWLAAFALICLCVGLVLAPDLVLKHFNIDLGFSLKWASGVALA